MLETRKGAFRKPKSIKYVIDMRYLEEYSESGCVAVQWYISKQR